MRCSPGVAFFPLAGNPGSGRASVAPPLVRPGHGERQRHGGERGDLPVERAGQEELVEDHHGDGLAEDDADGHHLQRERRHVATSTDGGRGTGNKINTGTAPVSFAFSVNDGSCFFSPRKCF